MRLVQLKNVIGERLVALVAEPNLQIIQGFGSVYELALEAIKLKVTLPDLINLSVTSNRLIYDEVYNGHSEWALLPAFDHPADVNLCMVAGTGLTHRQSALNRQAMHSADAQLSDSMKMYLMGEEGGRPAAGEIGVQPEWFYKGNGSVLRAHGAALHIPSFGDDGGEEPEMASLYVVDDSGKPWRVGFATMNEFSDHVMEKKNYLYLAPSKIRNCSIGPELVVTADFEDVRGYVRILRKEQLLWENKISTGNKNMCHHLANLEYHHFKYENHRQPGQVHIHALGADAFSFGAGLALEDGDMMEVKWDGMGRSLKNPVYKDLAGEHLIQIRDICI